MSSPCQITNQTTRNNLQSSAICNMLTSHLLVSTGIPPHVVPCAPFLSYHAIHAIHVSCMPFLQHPKFSPPCHNRPQPTTTTINRPQRSQKPHTLFPFDSMDPCYRYDPLHSHDDLRSRFKYPAFPSILCLGFPLLLISLVVNHPPGSCFLSSDPSLNKRRRRRRDPSDFHLG